MRCDARMLSDLGRTAAPRRTLRIVGWGAVCLAAALFVGPAGRSAAEEEQSTGANSPGVAGQDEQRGGGTATSKSAKLDFARDVHPILESRCFECHGPKMQESGLRLDLRERVFAGGDSGLKAVVAGKPDESELIRRVRGDEPGFEMPPLGDPLTKDQVALLVRWVKAGAEWPADQAGIDAGSQPAHWAYRKPVRPDPPAVKNAEWVCNEIDRFVLARLEREGIEPSPEADRHHLIRRVTFDLTGLPPTIAEADAFVNDPRPDAYERAVDRLLESPAYGERWARLWLDLARYADSIGYGSDFPRVIWRYRDWVIQALNDNKPFDEFTIEQVAGDLLPNPTLDQRIATAFHRNTMTNVEGGTDDEEFRVAAIVDRVNTTMEVWMGITMACAQCHTHKYDPITQREYYRFFAFFNNTADADRDDEAPTIPSPTSAQAVEQRRIEGEIAEIESQLKPHFDGDEWTEAASLLRIDEKKRKKEQREKLEGLLSRLDAETRALADRWKQHQDEIDALGVVTTPVMVELSGDARRRTHVMVRGSFLDKGEEVAPGVPEVFHPIPEDAPRNRLGLARWLVDPDNPLTPRVMINRIWDQYFGVGLVETSEDFGVQGDPPSHPELLDWLATEFVRNGWDMKAVHRLIVTSATYRQSTRIRPDLAERDARNRLLARGPRLRLEAEMIRDQALAASGLLSPRMLGPSVKPPQPEGLWMAAFDSRYRKWETSTGPDRYRRGLYTFLRRTIPYPSMLTFDAPSREVCTVRRPRTNTPLQALVTLNDPVYVEAAQGLARRIVREGGGDARERAAFGFRSCTTRPPESREIDRLVTLYELELAHYRDHPEAARKLATSILGPAAEDTDLADLAAWTVVANVLLNLDESLTKG